MWALTELCCTLLQIVETIKGRQEEQPLPETELIQCIWQGLIASVEWSARQDQNEALVIREITVSDLSSDLPCILRMNIS